MGIVIQKERGDFLRLATGKDTILTDNEDNVSGLKVDDIVIVEDTLHGAKTSRYIQLKVEQVKETAYDTIYIVHCVYAGKYEA